MHSIVLTSTNPVKRNAVLTGFLRMFPDSEFYINSIEAPSGVSDQPLDSHETLQGALNRSAQAQEKFPDADFWVGIEGGVEPMAQGLASFAWIVVRSRLGLGLSRTGTFFLPPAVAELIREGKELGEADDIVFGRTDSKSENGAIGLLTGNIIDRAELYAHAVVLALVSFKNTDLYGINGDKERGNR
jgi:inosine/xanthosine triphosphatase